MAASYACPMDPQEDDGFEVKCPKCKRRVKVTKDAERAMQVKCPCGEVIPLAKMS
jgi:DNA-directed RNA polymerase subunit RPC12/RpoP